MLSPPLFLICMVYCAATNVRDDAHVPNRLSLFARVAEENSLWEDSTPRDYLPATILKEKVFTQNKNLFFYLKDI